MSRTTINLSTLQSLLAKLLSDGNGGAEMMMSKIWPFGTEALGNMDLNCRIALWMSNSSSGVRDPDFWLRASRFWIARTKPSRRWE